jgi:hypothetical protein
LLCSSFAVRHSLFAAFEDPVFGVRPLGMAGAFTAVADDSSALHVNPAGLGQARYSELSLDYSRLYVGLNDDSDLGVGHVAFAHPLARTRYGVMALGYADMSLSGAYTEQTFAAAYGKRVLPRFYAGGALKWLGRKFGSDIYTVRDPLFQKNGKTASAVGIDLGTLYVPTPRYAFGFALKDFNEPDVGLGSTDRVPMTAKAGLAYYQPSFVFSTDLSLKDSDALLSAASEKWFLRHTLAARGGLSLGSRNERTLSIGLGYRFQLFRLDYAIVFPLSSVGDIMGSHHIALTARFGTPVQKPVTLLETAWEPPAEDVLALQRQLRDLRRQGDGMADLLDRANARIFELEARLDAGRPAAAPVSSDTEDQLEIYRMEAETYRREREVIEKRIKDLERELQKGASGGPLSIPMRALTPSVPGSGGIPATYETKAGDTLRSIATKFYNDPNKWRSLYELNKDRLGPGGTITPGQVLIMPPKE